MSTQIKGRDIQPDDEFKSAGIWYTVLHFIEQSMEEKYSRVAYCRTRKGAKMQIAVSHDDYYPVNRPLPREQRLRGKVRIRYSERHAIMWSRDAYVVRDDGGPKVQVEWQAADGPKVGRRVVAYHGARHVQWIPRERLEARS